LLFNGRCMRDFIFALLRLDHWVGVAFLLLLFENQESMASFLVKSHH
jgi:hypothetical protein